MTKKTQYRIEQLIFIADDFLKLTEELDLFYASTRDKVVKNLQVLNSDELKTFVIQQKLYFSEVLLILRTIFESAKKPKEISYENLFKEISEDTQYFKSYANIFREYKSSSLKDFVDQLIAHKDTNYAGDPSTHYLNPIETEHIQNCRKIVSSLIKLNNKYNSSPAGNNWIGLYEHSVSLVEIIKNRLTLLINPQDPTTTHKQ
jgi:hypothetical protein